LADWETKLAVMSIFDLGFWEKECRETETSVLLIRHQSYRSTSSQGVVTLQAMLPAVSPIAENFLSLLGASEDLKLEAPPPLIGNAD
jgi:hypothetical protein